MLLVLFWRTAYEIVYAYPNLWRQADQRAEADGNVTFAGYPQLSNLASCFFTLGLSAVGLVVTGWNRWVVLLCRCVLETSRIVGVVGAGYGMLGPRVMLAGSIISCSDSLFGSLIGRRRRRS